MACVCICHPVVMNAERCSLAAVLLLVTFGSGEPRLYDFRDVTRRAKREGEGIWNWLEACPRAGTGRGQRCTVCSGTADTQLAPLQD